MLATVLPEAESSLEQALLEPVIGNQLDHEGVKGFFPFTVSWKMSGRE